MPVLKFRKLNRYYHLYRQNNLFDGITLICSWGAFDSHRGGHKFILCKNDLDIPARQGFFAHFGPKRLDHAKATPPLEQLALDRYA